MPNVASFIFQSEIGNLLGQTGQLIWALFSYSESANWLKQCLGVRNTAGGRQVFFPCDTRNFFTCMSSAIAVQSISIGIHIHFIEHQD